MRQLTVTYSLELSQDLLVFHGIDIESEILKYIPDDELPMKITLEEIE